MKIVNIFCWILILSTTVLAFLNVFNLIDMHPIIITLPFIVAMFISFASIIYLYKKDEKTN